jgi:hypothetical protein
VREEKSHSFIFLTFSPEITLFREIKKNERKTRRKLGKNGDEREEKRAESSTFHAGLVHSSYTSYRNKLLSELEL